jgi:2-aminoadipate transaminase
MTANTPTHHHPTPSAFAKRINHIPRSCVREILTLSSGTDLISFGGGRPHPSCIPTTAITAAFESIMRRHGSSAFQYSSSEGEPELREFIASSWLARQGVKAHPSEILIVNGSQQALDLLGKVLVDKSAPLLVERPTYLAALQAFASYEPRYVEVNLEADGPDIEQLNAQLMRHKPRFFYTIPTFQNPSGVCCSAPKREAIAAALNRSGCLLIEDDPYSELYFDTPPPPPICALGVHNSVLLGTFSKTVAPGFRLGWIWARGELLRHLITVKQAADLCTGSFGQLLLAETLKHIDIDGHLSHNRTFYRSQRDSMEQILHQHLGEELSWQSPPGGMFFWGALRQARDTAKLLQRCIARGIAYADGSSFYAHEPAINRLRINFTNSTHEEMQRGVALLAEVLHEEMR